MMEVLFENSVSRSVSKGGGVGQPVTVIATPDVFNGAVSPLYSLVSEGYVNSEQ